MKTITIQIGNTDNKLTQQDWAAFVLMVRTTILKYCINVEFCGGPPNWERWQNVAWVINIKEENIPRLKSALSLDRVTFNQDSVAWTEGITEFI